MNIQDQQAQKSNLNVINGNQVIRVNASDPQSLINSGRKDVSNSPKSKGRESLAGLLERTNEQHLGTMKPIEHHSESMGGNTGIQSQAVGTLNNTGKHHFGLRENPGT